jgi:hypothetical protein
MVPDMAEAKKYTGGCQCGKIRYEVELDLSGAVTACNCSMCGRAGTLLTFVPADRFTLLSGEESLTDYRFNKERIHHFFCSTCGIKSFARGLGKGDVPMVAINARCLDGVEVNDLQIRHFDGRSL